jgi:ankyrin repeat protein
VRALLAKGADVDTKDEYGITALMRASQHGHLKSVNLLLDKGSDVNATDKIGWTALMHATVDGRREVVKVLLAKGARDKNIALIAALKKGHSEVVKALRANGGDVQNDVSKVRASSCLAHASPILDDLRRKQVVFP